MARRDRSSSRDFPRTARLNQLLREILGDALEAIDDERIELATITAVEVEPDLRHATVYFDTLEGEQADETTTEVLGELRIRLQGAIARQARLKRTPELSFRPDPGVRGGERIDEIIRELHEHDAPAHDRRTDETT
jgi:ribosome-binding factor A